MVASQKSERGEARKKCEFLRSSAGRASACDSQSVHLCAVEGAARHLLDAISGEPSVSRKRSQVTDRKLPDASVFAGPGSRRWVPFWGLNLGD